MTTSQLFSLYKCIYIPMEQIPYPITNWINNTKQNTISHTPVNWALPNLFNHHTSDDLIVQRQEYVEIYLRVTKILKVPNYIWCMLLIWNSSLMLCAYWHSINAIPHPDEASSSSMQCLAEDLCFNVALNNGEWLFKDNCAQSKK